MTEELDVLRIFSERLRAADVPFMLTGSFALGYYGKPRITRALKVDLIVRKNSEYRHAEFERRLAFAKRLYAGELPDAALLAFAEWNG